MPGRFLSTRYAAFYGAFFLTFGVYLPFWPVWLAHRGLTPEQIGVVLAVGSWVKVLGIPAVAQIADRSGRPKITLVVVAALTVLSVAAYLPAQGFWAILGVTVVAAILSQSMNPLAESLTMAAVVRERLDYGRIRLWGSLAFILGTVGAGRLLTGRDGELILLLVLAGFALTLVAVLLYPDQRPPRASAGWRRVTTLLSNRRFVVFLIAASLLQASHAVYYGFSALHWKAAGLSETAIGWLWAEGVIAEVLLFAVSGAAVARLGPAGLLIAAGAAGVLRWVVLGTSTDLAALVAVQGLHAATFGAVHLGAMHFIARSAPAGLAATAQAAYAAVSGGIAMGLAMLFAGGLYEAFGGGAFHAMAALCAIGALLAIPLARRESMA